MITLLESGIDVSMALAQLEASPELWNEYNLRTSSEYTPHKQVSDIWVRYNPWRNYDGCAYSFTQNPHESEWYEGSAKVPAVIDLTYEVMRKVRGSRLGGVLITRIDPHGQVNPHIDSGWHARFYDKYAIQLMANEKQAFHFDDCSLVTKPGDLYTFDNSKTHWVTNDSDDYRMTLIICIRK